MKLIRIRIFFHAHKLAESWIKQMKIIINESLGISTFNEKIIPSVFGRHLAFWIMELNATASLQHIENSLGEFLLGIC